MGERSDTTIVESEKATTSWLSGATRQTKATVRYPETRATTINPCDKHQRLSNSCAACETPKQHGDYLCNNKSEVGQFWKLGPKQLPDSSTASQQHLDYLHGSLQASNLRQRVGLDFLLRSCPIRTQLYRCNKPPGTASPTQRIGHSDTSQPRLTR